MGLIRHKVENYNWAREIQIYGCMHIRLPIPYEGHKLSLLYHIIDLHDASHLVCQEKLEKINKNDMKHSSVGAVLHLETVLFYSLWQYYILTLADTCYFFSIMFLYLSIAL